VFKPALCMIALCVLSSSAVAQPASAPAPAAGTFISSADIAKLAERVRQGKAPAAPLASGRMVEAGSYRANLEYRTSVGNAAIHETEAELFVVLEGKASVVTGGTLLNGRRTNPENLSGEGILNGETRPIAKGDTFIVPKGVAHWFTNIDAPLVLMSVHLPQS